jgi:hypothetical protein
MFAAVTQLEHFRVGETEVPYKILLHSNSVLSERKLMNVQNLSSLSK